MPPDLLQKAFWIIENCLYIKIYPNPTLSYFKIRKAQLQLGGNFKVSLRLDGRQISAIQVSSSFSHALVFLQAKV